jgi:hypothetical protein
VTDGPHSACESSFQSQLLWGRRSVRLIRKLARPFLVTPRLLKQTSSFHDDVSGSTTGERDSRLYVRAKYHGSRFEGFSDYERTLIGA